jgi:hypothetical protein
MDSYFLVYVYEDELSFHFVSNIRVKWDKSKEYVINLLDPELLILQGDI